MLSDMDIAEMRAMADEALRKFGNAAPQINGEAYFYARNLATLLKQALDQITSYQANDDTK